ncbi:histidine phosphatase family protein [Kitasatospora acidiphila]|uniref:Histidine phosphatase family protein n=1 Tax=Kitasatospora acidiphila TaxID=2567942 RepID=A0A540VYU7_9ACTN|nr:histidine phosphatase family protein [Kitasatospora acidiphila]TQF01935.1 histidine phosphatase family protein [Kitasatospora acidiphila]
MADIWLMRHAAYQGHQTGHHAHPGAPLSDEGREQARHAARSVPDGIVGIVTSTMPRARETAEILANHTSLPLVAALPIFAEWQAPSIVYGRGPGTYPERYTAWQARRREEPELRCGDGESLADLHARAMDGLTLLNATARQGSLLLISHALYLGVLTRLGNSAAVAFEDAARDLWQFTETRVLTTLTAGN